MRDNFVVVKRFLWVLGFACLLNISSLPAQQFYIPGAINLR
jgi:hypothetical protein